MKIQKQNRKENFQMKVWLSLLIIVGITFFLANLVSAGFGSSYVPEINGENTLEIPINSNISYFIYPQNFESKTLLVKINIKNGSNFLINTLQETYSVPPNTTSDDFKIELKFGLKNDTSLIGKKFLVSYEVLSTLQQNVSGIVTFNPIGFTKKFYISGKPETSIHIEVVINQTNTTQTTQTEQSSSTTSTVSKSKTPAKTPETPKQEQPSQEDKTPITQVAVVPSSNILSFLKEIWATFSIGMAIWIGIGIIVSLIIVFLIIKLNKGSNNTYKNYNETRYIEE